MKKSSEYKLAIFSAFIGVIFTAIYDWVKEKPIFSTLWNSLKWIWKNIFEYELKLWVILCITIPLFLIRKIIKSAKPIDVPNRADWLNYTNDSIDKLEWKWRWRLSGSNKYSIDDLKPICPKCGTSMDLTESSFSLASCPRCDNYLTDIKNSQKIEAIILDNIDRNLYKKT